MIKGNVLASALTLAVTAIACVFGSVLASRLALGWLSLRQVLDRPNERSSHSSPVPRGGGIGFATVILVALAALYGIERQVPPAVLVGALSVSAISFADDLRPVSYRLRFLVQAFAVTVVLALLPADTPIVTDSLPIWLDRLLVGLAWLWFINLFNFMDGIDGIAAGEAVVIAGGALGLALLQTNFGEAALPAIIIAASAAAFLAYNWHPAKLFMGDVGSTALGFFLGWLLIEAAAAGFLAAAFILPMFFLVDASSTLIVRAIRGRPLATAHRHPCLPGRRRPGFESRRGRRGGDGAGPGADWPCYAFAFGSDHGHDRRPHAFRRPGGVAALGRPKSIAGHQLAIDLLDPLTNNGAGIA